MTRKKSKSKKRKVVVYYQTVTEESAEHGDYDSEGFYEEYIVEPDKFEADEGQTAATLAVKFINHHGAIEPSSSHFHKGIWYTSIDPKENYQTGEKMYFTFHPENFSEFEEAKIHQMLMGKRKKNPVNSELLDFLEKHHVFWGRDKNGDIWVMTSGYKTHHDLGHYGIEKVMMKHGYYMADEEFDQMSGQTKATYKKRKGKVKNPKSKNPFDGVAVAKKDRPRVSAKIRKLMHEGYPAKQAVAIALSMYAEHKLGPRGGRVKKTHKPRKKK